MDNPPQRIVNADCRQERGHLRFLAHIRLDDPDLGAQRLHPRYFHLCFGSGLAAPHKDQMACPLFYQPLGNGETQAAQATGNQIGGIGSKRGGGTKIGSVG